VSNFTGTGIETPLGITSGPDGALWFTNVNNNSIGRITTSGVVSDYPGTGFNPLGITAGPDGALWFTNSNSNSIGRITTAGVISDYVGSGIDYPDAIVAGVDGALWFTNANNNSIGRITTDGGITNYADTTIDFPWGITAGPDGDLWFANEDNASIGRITSLPRVFISPASGAPGSSVAVSGSGYSSGEQVNVIYKTDLAGQDPSTVAICSAIANEDGTFSCLGHVPHASIAGTAGDHVMRATGKASGTTAKTLFSLT
jgi:sugar lactone lactonase YvrE